MKEFRLTDDFLTPYKFKIPAWGPMGEFVYLRTYSRKIEGENRNEQWWETVRRVVEGTYTIQKEHCDNLRLAWNSGKAHKSAEKMFDKIFNFKFLPPGRGLWMMGTDFVKQKGSAALNNCAFISSIDIDTRGSFMFTWTMDALMLGVGVGFDTKGADKILIKATKPESEFIIQDTRESWVESLGFLLDAYFKGGSFPSFDYSLIRPYGTPIKGFGGVASGPDPLKKMHENINTLLLSRVGSKLHSTDIVDIINMISVCVIAGNVRRSACLGVGEHTDKAYVTMKDYNLHPTEVQSHRWASNNSVFAEVGKTDYSSFADSIALNGEPGIIWLENIRKYSRTKDAPDWKDQDAVGVNPCQPAWAKVLTPEGIREFKDISIGSKIWSKEGWTTVVNKWHTGVKPVYRYTTKHGGIFEGTSNHRIVQSGEKIEVKFAESIDVFPHALLGGCMTTLTTPSPLIKMELVSEEDVYDITVDNDSHTYWTNGCDVSNCGEQTLENAELCCLVETFPSLHDSYDEYSETLKYAYLYAKTVTLLATHWPETNAILLKNRRIGLSQSGIQDAFVKHGRRTMLDWSDEGYNYVQKLDQIYSNWLCIPRSKKTTSVKPSGSVSLLPGVSPGIHYPHAEYYIRRVRVSRDSPIADIMMKAGYTVEEDAYGDSNTVVVVFPVHELQFSKKKDTVSIWEQVKNVVDYQRFWADNNVSVTVTFKQSEKNDIVRVLECYEDSLKAISFLPIAEHGYKQAPYEEVSKEVYEELHSKLTRADFSAITSTPLGSKFCDGDSCTLL